MKNLAPQQRRTTDDLMIITSQTDDKKSGGKYDFEDGGAYRGKWVDGKAHGLGVCTGPGGQGKFSGMWDNGFETLGLYEWPNGDTYAGNWSKGYRHHLGVEVREGWVYKGEWQQGVKGNIGTLTNDKGSICYEGKWKDSLKNGIGVETYADGGTYRGEWVAGKRHGIGVRKSATYARASTRRSNFQHSFDRSEPDIRNESSFNQRIKNGFVTDQTAFSLHFHLNYKNNIKTSRKMDKTGRGLLRSASKSTLSAAFSMISLAKSEKHNNYKTSLNKKKLKMQEKRKIQFRSFDGGDPSSSVDENEHNSIPNDDITETYYGEWNNNSRHGYGVCMRSDGLVYEGQWANDQRQGYGVTTFPQGQVFEGHYKLNLFVGLKKQTLLPKKSKEKVQVARMQANKAKKSALRISEHATTYVHQCRSVAIRADQVATNARKQGKIADKVAYEINRKSLMNKKAITISEDKIREAEIQPIKSSLLNIAVPQHLNTTPKTYPSNQNNNFENKDKGLNGSVDDLTKSSEVKGFGTVDPKIAEMLLATMPTQKTVSSSGKSKSLFRNRAKETQVQTDVIRNIQSKQKQQQKRNPAQQQQQNFDWKKADASSKRNRWASQMSEARIISRKSKNEPMATAKKTTNNKVLSPKARKQNKHNTVKEESKSTRNQANATSQHISLEVQALKPRNMNARGNKLPHQRTINTIDPSYLLDNDLDCRDYSSFNYDIEDADYNSQISSAAAALSNKNSESEIVVYNQQFRNVYQMILVFVINVGFVFMIMRIPSTFLPDEISIYLETVYMRACDVWSCTTSIVSSYFESINFNEKFLGFSSLFKKV